jgi:hypothetical protein
MAATPRPALLATLLIRALFPKAEGRSYYAGLHSEPTLLYRTGKEQWFPPSGPEAQRRLKELGEVFTHPITKVWNHDLGWKVVEVMDAHTVS